MSESEREKKRNSFYVEENVKDRLKEKDVSINDLSLSELLASERTDLANKRNILALKRNIQASDRTYAAWIRTGFSIVSAGVAFSGWLRQSDAEVLSAIVGSLLVLVGLLTFVFAWYSYYESYKWLNNIATDEQVEGVPNTNDFVVISIVTSMLLLISVSALVVVIFA